MKTLNFMKGVKKASESLNENNIVMRDGNVPHTLNTARKALGSINQYLNKNISMGGKTTSQVKSQIKNINKTIVNVQKMIDKADDAHESINENEKLTLDK